MHLRLSTQRVNTTKALGIDKSGAQPAEDITENTAVPTEFHSNFGRILFRFVFEILTDEIKALHSNECLKLLKTAASYI